VTHSRCWRTYSKKSCLRWADLVPQTVYIRQVSVTLLPFYLLACSFWEHQSASSPPSCERLNVPSCKIYVTADTRLHKYTHTIHTPWHATANIRHSGCCVFSVKAVGSQPAGLAGHHGVQCDGTIVAGQDSSAAKSAARPSRRCCSEDDLCRM
jgi:hypothetical protein